MKAGEFEQLVSAHSDAFTDRRIYTDPAILEEEREKIFRRTWIYICHESQFEKAGDFKCMSIVDEPLIVVRGDDGKIRAFFNSCRHRASLVEIESEGNREEFECPYHGFKYDRLGALTTAPVEEGFGDWFDKADFGLVPLPRIETFNGMVFGSLNAEVAPLLDYLGPAAEMMAYNAIHEDGKIAVVDTLKYEIEANWKLLIDNSLDGYHVPFVHGLMMNNHPDQRMPDDTAPPADVGPDFARQLGFHGTISWKARQPASMRVRNQYMSIFPNTTLHYNAGEDLFGIRQIEPVAVDRMRVTLYHLAPTTMDEETRLVRAASYSMMWGPGGLFGSEDGRQLEWVQKGLNARSNAPVMAARGMGLEGDGAYIDEHPLRGFRAGWTHYMGRSGVAK